MTVSAAKQQEIIERRMKVSALRLSGFRRQDKIAEELKVSKATIHRDFLALDLIYKERAASDIAIAKGIDLERIDELIFAIWTRAKGGSLPAIEEIRQLLATRAKLMGLDAPKRQWLSGPHDGPIPIQEEDIDLSTFTEEELRQFHDAIGAIITAQEITQEPAANP
ncbi:hypothetical protein LCGC14_3057930 [marine sediment metagenome]|uniref:Uncharacterized protein n=1 Tax=marine sediment metagenome TaxID=412755 RepID=A0A0F8ZAJ6_9ZZZZ